VTNTPKLSIITVNLKNASGLGKTLDSLARQTFINYEHLIIDGGSTDGSIEVIKAYEKQYNGIENGLYWISELDKGIYNAMNKGIKVAKGEYSPVDVDLQSTSHKATDLKSGNPRWCGYTIPTLFTGTIPESQGFAPGEALTKPDKPRCKNNLNHCANHTKPLYCKQTKLITLIKKETNTNLILVSRQAKIP
jgi:cellulose synthase/poly-beta-1,6-N-acetylglucosamine synthase-like glycosyltransferase